MKPTSSPLRFLASQPSAYDSLGLIHWELPRAWCPDHHELNAGEIEFRSQYYDGFSWAYPVCRHCGRSMSVYSYPVAMDERRIYFRKNKAAWHTYVETYYLALHRKGRSMEEGERLFAEQKNAHLGVRLPWMIEQNLP